MDIIRDEDFDSALSHLGKDYFYLKAAIQKKEKVHVSTDLTQRERERRIRDSLQSQHGPTAELHDQVIPKIMFLKFFVIKNILGSSIVTTSCFLFYSGHWL